MTELVRRSHEQRDTGRRRRVDRARIRALRTEQRVDLARTLRFQALPALVGEVGLEEAAVHVLIHIAGVCGDGRWVGDLHDRTERRALYAAQVTEEMPGELYAVGLVAVRAASDGHVAHQADRHGCRYIWGMLVCRRVGERCRRWN
eukprot:scaffold3550_cov112-Isochrysis_galbana.AAC.17